MRRALSRLVSLVALTCLAASSSGCAAKPEKRLVGKWSASVEATLSSPQFKAMPDDQREAARKGLEMFSASTVEFRDDGKFVVEVPGMKEEGDWSVSAVNGETLTIHSTLAKSGKSKDFPATLRPEGVDLTLFGTQPVLFVRK